MVVPDPLRGSVSACSFPGRRRGRPAHGRIGGTAPARGGGTVTVKQRRSADWLALLTTLDARGYPAERVVALYRLRWQVELAFKRLKDQLRLGDLQAKEPRLARACLLAKLILALLVERRVDRAGRPFWLAPTRARRPPCGA